MSSEKNADATNDALVAISDVARQRREKAKPDIEKKPPKWLLETSQSEVTFNLGRRFLPIGQIDFSILRTAMQEQFKMSFEKPDGMALLSSKLGTELKASEEQLADILLSSESPALRFEGGRFPTSRDDFIEIRSVTITDEMIYVVVRGKSHVAELVAKETAELIWQAAGVSKKWDDINAGVRLIGFATGTLVDLGIPAIGLVSASVLDFVRSEIVEGTKFSASMCPYSYRNDFQPSKSTLAVFSLNELSLAFHMFDTTTGRDSSAHLRFRVTEREMEGGTRVYVTSGLPFDKHVECIGLLISQIKGK